MNQDMLDTLAEVEQEAKLLRARNERLKSTMQATHARIADALAVRSWPMVAEALHELADSIVPGA